MCGLVGIAGKLEYKDEATIKRLLLMDYFRGTDSTGLAAIRKTGEHMLAKIASHPIDLFDSKMFEKTLNAFQSKAFIGHNRAATRGKVNGVNAHPYQYGDIIGAHNGTLDHKSWDELNKVLGYETDTDSMAVFACIEKVGIEETVKMLCGAWALVWVDLTDNTLNFLRNKERPLWFASTKDYNKVFWASEWPMIQAATEMGGKDAYDIYIDKGGFSYFPLEEDQLYQCDLDKLSAGDYTDLPLVKMKKLEGKAPPPVVTTTYNHGGGPFIPGKTNSTTTTTLGTTSGSDKKKLPPQLTIITTEKSPFGKMIDEITFELTTNGKCGYCNGPVVYSDEGVVFFEGMEEALCPKCSGHSTSRYMALPGTYHKYLTNQEVN